MRRVVLLAAVSAAGWPAPGWAEMPDMDVLNYATLVSDEELDGMRGRFAAGGKVQFFGLQLYTYWQTGDGVVMSTAMTLGVDFAGRGGGSGVDASVTAHFFHEDRSQSDLPEPPPPPVPVPESESVVVAPQTAGSGGLEAVDGLVQSIQLAGVANGARNGIRIDVLPDAASIGPLMPDGPLGEPVTITGTTVSVSSSGTVQSAILEPSTLGVSVEVPLQGIALQRVRGTDIGQIAQHVRAAGNFNDIANLMHLTFQLSSTSQATRANILSALDSLRGLR